MPAGQYLTFFALACNLLLGISVFAMNVRRPTNRSFFLYTVFATGWLVSLACAFHAHTKAEALFWIRACSTFGPLAVPSLGLLRISIIYYQETWGQHLWRLWPWFAAAIAAAIIAGTPLSLKGVIMPVPGSVAGPESIPHPIYGPGDNVQLAFLLVSVLSLVFLLVRDQLGNRLQGIRRIELQFIFLACLSVLLTLFLAALMERLLPTWQVVRIAPLRVVFFTFIIAYGITSRGILHVRAFLRLLLSYAFLGFYAGIIFALSWLACAFVFKSVAHNESPVAFSAAVLTVLLLNVTGTPMRRITKVILPPEIDFEKIVTVVNQLVQRVTILEQLIPQFCSVLSKAVGAPSVTVLLADASDRAFVGDSSTAGTLAVNKGDVLGAWFEAGERELSLEELQRRPPSAQRDELLERMECLDCDLILPIRYHDQISGILVFTSRPSGKIYGASGRATLQLIAAQLGVAIANSRLYTEARQSQAYNQFLVEHLTCGVIATDPNGGLTVVNPEARRLLGLDELAPPADLNLPEEIARLIPATLEGDFVGRDEEIILHAGARDEVNLRVSCLPFASEISRLLGAVLVLNDYSAIERLQRQIRQADRLASIGTLASGMAHEIKNPLTALKTFTQLLPKRYEDPEFRSDFALLGGNEILRIERIVNDLLAFARPAPLMIEQVNLHDIIAAAVRLVTPQAAKLNIEVRTALLARTDFVAVDRDRLQQVLLNLILNALQASETGGWVELRTESEEGTLLNEPSIRLDVRDGGHGISKEMLPHIFDPFFTTKSEGTGLGLSVSYNIIAEHKGRMEVASETGEGTCFSIYLPAA